MDKKWALLPPRANRVVRLLWTLAAMFIIGFGINLQIHAGIGLSPWASLSMGISNQLPISYGTANICVSFVIITVDLCLHASIGFATLIDAVFVGTFMDIWNKLLPLSTPDNLAVQIIMLVVGLTVVCFGQYLYMEAALGCGPRDSMFVAIGKQFPKVSVGFVNNIIFAVVLMISWALGAPIGIGTVIAVLANGSIMDLVFKIMNFDARAVAHENMLDTVKVFLKNPAEAE